VSVYFLFFVSGFLAEYTFSIIVSHQNPV